MKISLPAIVLTEEEAAGIYIHNNPDTAVPKQCTRAQAIEFFVGQLKGHTSTALNAAHNNQRIHAARALKIDETKIPQAEARLDFWEPDEGVKVGEGSDDPGLEPPAEAPPTPPAS